MAKSLVIVESVAKTKTVGKFLGKDFAVMSSVGHIKDLPKQRLGIRLDDGFEPEYITIRGKGKTLSELRRAAGSVDRVYVATDPDREGEAIASHLAEEIREQNSNIFRVMFNEITEHAVRQALAHPREIDVKLVEAQKARRVVDRLVGYQVSPILWRTIYRGLSAGRVQSVALRLICEREELISQFVSEEYWSITAELHGRSSSPFFARLVQIDGKKPVLPNDAIANEVVAELRHQPYRVLDIRKKQIKRQPAPPFTTSTMQQEAARRLGFTAKRIMMIAQQLYEGVELGAREGSVGLITYMRTDSVRVASEAVAAAREFIYTNFGKEYVPKEARYYKAKAGAQDAHEAIRPTSMKREPKSIKKYLTVDQFKLYELIWQRFVASQMNPAEIEQTSIDTQAGTRFLLRTTGSTIVFRGFLQVFGDFQDEEAEENGDSSPFPRDLKIGESLTLIALHPRQHFTKPPARYSESSLVKELDSLGIGRPSTYAMIISTLLVRKYVEKMQRQLVPTDLGKTVNKILVTNFPEIFNVRFTAFMEEELDKVESGDKEFLQVVQEFYDPFNSAVAKTEGMREAIKDALRESTSEVCPQCGKPLIIRWGRNGKFMACSGYPDCKYSKPIAAAEEVPGEVCDKCGKPMVAKVGRYGRFLACSGYPECKSSRPFPLGVTCPKDGGQIIERRTKRGRAFYGCSNYPGCDFATWAKPVAKSCPSCGNPYVEERYTQARGAYFRCPKCKAEMEAEVEGSDGAAVFN